MSASRIQIKPDYKWSQMAGEPERSGMSRATAWQASFPNRSKDEIESILCPRQAAAMWLQKISFRDHYRSIPHNHQQSRFQDMPICASPAMVYGQFRRLKARPQSKTSGQ